MRRLIPLGDDIRSCLGTVALLVLGLPAVVLVLTLLDDDLAPRPMQTPDSGDGRSVVAQRQAPRDNNQRGASGEGNVRSLKRHGLSSRGSPEDNGASSTRRTETDQKVIHQSQEGLDAATGAPATATEVPTPTDEVSSQSAPTAPTAEPAPASTEPATPLAPPSAPGTAEAQATVTPSTPVAAETPPASEPSTPAIDVPILQPSEVPLDGHGDYNGFEQVRELP